VLTEELTNQTIVAEMSSVDQPVLSSKLLQIPVKTEVVFFPKLLSL